MHSSLNKDRTSCDWLDLGGRGHAVQTCPQVKGPDKPSQALMLEGSGRLLRKVTWQTTSCWQKRRATLGLSWKGYESENSVPFLMQAILFSLFFVCLFVILAKFLVIIIYYYFFLFKIRSQYTRFSLFGLCTEVQKSQPFITFRASVCPAPPFLFAVGEARAECGDSASRHRLHLDPAAANAPKSD